LILSGKEIENMNTEIANKLIENGVKNLKEYGYPNVDADNIFTDMIYSAFFSKMLKEALGNGLDEEVTFLIDKIKTDTE
jgi:hypothetical protein